MQRQLKLLERVKEKMMQRQLKLRDRIKRRERIKRKTTNKN